MMGLKERLTRKNAELCNALAAAQYSRATLEKESVALKLTLLEERSQATHSDVQTHSLLEEMKLVVSENENLRACLDEATREKLESYKIEIDELRQHQLTEIDLRCREVDSLKEQLSGQLETLTEENSSLAGELETLTEGNSSLAGQLETLTEENSSLAGQVTDLTSQSRQLQEKLAGSELEWRCQFEQMSNKYSRLLRDKEGVEGCVINQSEMVEQLKARNIALKSQHGLVERKLDESLRAEKEGSYQLVKKLQAKSSMMATVISEVESARASHAVVTKQLNEVRGEVDQLKAKLHSMSELKSEMKLLLEQRACRIQHLEKALHKHGPEQSLVLSSAVNTTSANVKVQHLSTPNLRLEVQLGKLKTDNAKLTGSYNALLAIKDKFSIQNSRLSSRNRDLQTCNRALTGDKQFLLRKVEALSRDCLQLSASQQAFDDKLVKMCGSKEEWDINEISCQLQLEKGEWREDAIKRQSLQYRLSALQRVIGQEVQTLDLQASECADKQQVSLQYLRDVNEELRLCTTHNHVRQVQVELMPIFPLKKRGGALSPVAVLVCVLKVCQWLQECDRTTMALQGEVEVMRAKKVVFMSMVAFSNRALPAAIDRLGSLTYTATVSGSMLSQAQHNKEMKLERKKANFLRVRLGYAISELRLYRKQKLSSDQQLNQIQEDLAQVQRHYTLCAQQLARAQRIL